MDQQFTVVFTGEIKPGTDRDAFIQGFSQRFKCDEAKAAEVYGAGKAITMKNAVSQAVAEEFKKALEALGMTIRLDPIPASVTPAATATPEAPRAEANPYQAPSANLQQGAESGEMSGPASVPFGHGWQWISSAYSGHFKGNALPWIGAVVLLVIISVIPFLNLLTQFLMPVFVGGLMLGARAQDQGEPFEFTHLFSGFKQNTGQLLLISVLFIVSIIILMFVISLVMGGSIAMMGGMEMGNTAPDPLAMLLPMLVMMLFFLPLMMAYWFAPALVAIENMSALTAMRLSFIGCLKNMLPFLLYGIALLVLMVVAMIPLGLGLLVMMPVMYASMYTSYRDIYYPAA